MHGFWNRHDWRGGAAGLALAALVAAACAAPAPDASGQSVAVQGTRAARDAARVEEAIVATAEAEEGAAREVRLQAAANAAEAERLALERQAIELAAYANQLAISQTLAATATPQAMLLEQEAYSRTLSAETASRVAAAEAWAEAEQAQAAGSTIAWTVAYTIAVIGALAVGGLIVYYVALAAVELWSGFRHRAARRASEASWAITPNAITIIPGVGPVVAWDGQIMHATTMLLAPPASGSVPGALEAGLIMRNNASPLGRAALAPELTAEQAALCSFIARCEAMVGPSCTRLPSATAYQVRYGGSRDAWMAGKAPLERAGLVASTGSGTRLISEVAPTVRDLLELARAGRIRLTATSDVVAEADSP